MLCGAAGESLPPPSGEEATQAHASEAGQPSAAVAPAAAQPGVSMPETLVVGGQQVRTLAVHAAKP